MSASALVLALLSLPFGGDEETDPEEPLAGHSHQGEAFNEGPRQAAYLMPDPGSVRFPVSTESEEAQAFFTQGVGHLHGFWYFEAERSFRQAAAIDPELAMAYWGMALANVENEERAAAFAGEGWLRREGASELERMHLDALAEYYDVDEAPSEGEERKRNPAPDEKRGQAYVEALEAILWKHPEHVETKALLVNYLWMGRNMDLPTVSKLSVEALLQDIFAVQPMHPAHHYRIHLWDEEETAERAIDSAVKAGHSWPTVAHQWHMGGHIFDQLGRYMDAAWQQEASARVDHAHLMRDRVLPDQIMNFAHNNEWLIRSWNHCGRMRESIDLARNMIELPRHPEWNMLGEVGCSASYGRRRLFDTLELFEQWEELARACDTAWLEPSEDARDEAKRRWMLGMAHAFLGDFEAARGQEAALEGLVEREKEERADSVDEAEELALSGKRKATEVRAAMEDALEEHEAAFRNLRRNIAALEALALVLETAPLPIPEPAEAEVPAAAEEVAPEGAGPEACKGEDCDACEPCCAGDDDEQEEDEDDYADEDEEEGEQDDEDDAASDPERPPRPAPDYPEEVDLALAALRKGALSKEQLALIHLRLGLHDRAESLARAALKDAESSAVPLAILAHVLFELGETEEALERFEELHARSSHLDLDAPAFARLAPLAELAGHPADWRLAYVQPEDVGDRPALDALGPRRWSPPVALPWTCADSKGVEHSLADHRGRPVVVILFLGFGCLHCVEQLSAFGPVADEFAAAGISMVAIGTDPAERVAESLDGMSAEERPTFPVLCDPELDVFHAWRAYDDFESLPLHGTFLVDGEGRVRWQDVGFEPFLDHEFLLTESKRLLALPATPPPALSKSATSGPSSGGAR